MKNKAVFSGGKIETLIYEIRNKQVMLDSDLAMLYECKNGTKTINLAVKRHKERFPEDFCFQLDENECVFLRSQFATANCDKPIFKPQIETSNEKLRFQSETSKRGKGGRRYSPWVFTEQGVAMLATVLRTEVASQVSIAIMRAFVTMKQYMSNNLVEQKYMNELVIEHNKRLNLVEETLSKFKEKNNHLFFSGQIYDAYSLLRKILEKSKKEIIIIDNYIDKNLLDILSGIDKKIIVITNEYNNNDYTKYKQQYHNVNLMIKNAFHDRFIIIDRKILYHSGASFKDLGSKCFAINKIDDKDYLKRLLDYIK